MLREKKATLVVFLDLLSSCPPASHLGNGMSAHVGYTGAPQHRASLKIFDLRNPFFRHDRRVSFLEGDTPGDLPGSRQVWQVQHNSGWQRVNSSLHWDPKGLISLSPPCLQQRQQARGIHQLLGVLLHSKVTQSQHQVGLGFPL
uniref:Uncharacterized protein n=1 Tax=Myotis myotis TaxID=51298 RepID=A0A7J7V3A6_MYOMY|nr:hypothetical protein mMyoMyo1_008408 [Myotis myotis]